MRRPRGTARPACIIIHETAPASYGWERRPELQHQRAVRHRPRRIRRRSTRRSKAGSSGRSRCSCSSAPGLDFEQAKAAARSAGLPADPAQGDAYRRNIRRQPQVINSRTMSSGFCRARNIRTRRSSIRRHWDHLGIGKPDATRRPHLQWRGRQRRPASPS